MLSTAEHPARTRHDCTLTDGLIEAANRSRPIHRDRRACNGLPDFERQRARQPLVVGTAAHRQWPCGRLGLQTAAFAARAPEHARRVATANRSIMDAARLGISCSELPDPHILDA